MKCELCEKELQGGFKQSNGNFQCARCVILGVEMNSLRNIFQTMDTMLAEGLKTGVRPTKSQLYNLRMWTKAGLARIADPLRTTSTTDPIQPSIPQIK